MAELSPKHRAFVAHYIENGFNGAAAARAAGYSEKDARNRAAEILKRDDVKNEVRTHLNALTATAEESLARITQRARGNALNLICVKYDEEGAISEADVTLKRAVETGEIANVRKVRKGRHGALELSLYDSLAADALLLRAHKIIGASGDDAPPRGSGEPGQDGEAPPRLLYPDVAVQVQVGWDGGSTERGSTDDGSGPDDDDTAAASSEPLAR